MHWSLTKPYHLRDKHFVCIKYCYFASRAFFSVSLRRILFFYFLNCEFSLDYSPIGVYDSRLNCCLDLKNTTQPNNELIVSSEHKPNLRNDQWIGSRITLEYGEDGCTVTHTYTHMYTYISEFHYFSVLLVSFTDHLLFLGFIMSKSISLLFV